MVSIIIPYYNRPNKIIRCINSILNQSYQSFEILIIDDASDIPLQLDIDKRIKIFRNKKNIGPGLSRNIGLDNAKGKYIAFIDSDDYWHKDFLNSTINILEKSTKYSFVYTQAAEIHDKKITRIRGSNSCEESILPNILFGRRPWSSSSCVWSKNHIGDVRYIDSRNWEDYLFNIQVALNNNFIKKIEYNLSYIDVSGEDKISKELFRFQEKTYSVLNAFNLLKNTIYFNNKKVKLFFNLYFINVLQNFHLNNLNSKFSEKDILIILKELNNSFIYFILNFSFKNLNKNVYNKVFRLTKKII